MLTFILFFPNSTNFVEMYKHLRSSGYYVEVLGQPYTCFDAQQYGTLLVVDPEEEFFVEEMDKLYDDYANKGLSVVIFADWYNVTLMKKVKFFDENTKQWWLPVTGGANVPALNELLSRWNIELGDQVFEGDFKIGDHEMYYGSGVSIRKFPEENSTLLYQRLNDQSLEMIEDKKAIVDNVPILGLLYNRPHRAHVNDSIGVVSRFDSGQLALYGDSNCLDSAHATHDCFWLLNAILQFTTTGQIPDILLAKHNGGGHNKDNQLNGEQDKKKLRDHIHNFISHKFGTPKVELKPNTEAVLPARIEDGTLFRYSNVISDNIGTRWPLPACRRLQLTHTQPRNATVPTYFHDWVHLQLSSESLDNMSSTAGHRFEPGDQSKHNDDLDFQRVNFGADEQLSPTETEVSTTTYPSSYQLVYLLLCFLFLTITVIMARRLHVFKLMARVLSPLRRRRGGVGGGGGGRKRLRLGATPRLLTRFYQGARQSAMSIATSTPIHSSASSSSSSSSSSRSPAV